MAKQRFSCAFYVLLLILMVNVWLLEPIQADDQRKTYIVYMGDKPIDDIPGVDVYLSMITEVLKSDVLHITDAAEYLMHTFENFKGCIVHLTDKEAELMSKMDGVVSVFLSEKHNLHTTRSWDFMDFPLDVERSSVESDVIIGVIDTGIWPESESFTDEGFGPPPAKWKGSCDTSLNFTCNNKLIGAQYFRADGNISMNGVASPRDTEGHGTHTASTAAGGVVDSASFLGLGQGTARGGVPSARITVYKACWSDGCYGADVLIAFDTAISDGVDIISVSAGRTGIAPYFERTNAIGSFHAMQKGILTSLSAGNEGPDLVTLGNYAPWQLTVAASTIDRKFITQVELGNGMVVEGISLNTFDPQNMSFPLIHGMDAQNTTSKNSSRFCMADSLNKTLVEGKIVMCDALFNGETLLNAGAAGIIMRGVLFHDTPRSFPLPASYLEIDDGTRVLLYTRNSTSTPYGTILKSVEIKDTSSPTIASFSSRGPNPISLGILKPDLTAPGVAILAAYSPFPSVTKFAGDPRHVSYKIISGTSMSCPHVSGVAAYVKSFHPTWSPAAIKSALMTTALPMSSASTSEAEFAYGSGHISPLKAVNPGLVYDANEDDYLNFLCNQGLTPIQISLISSKSYICSNISTNGAGERDLNYPSIALPTVALTYDAVFHRTVTNVGLENSTYSASVTTSSTQAVVIQVQPSVLEFKSVGEKLSFEVRVSGSILQRSLISASLVWDDGVHQVRSPIVVYDITLSLK